MTPDNPEVTMVERVARAIHNRIFEGDLGQSGSAEYAIYCAAARAAIEAMRVPTPAVVTALTPDGIPGPRLYGVQVREFCAALIDAALSEGVKGGGA